MAKYSEILIGSILYVETLMLGTHMETVVTYIAERLRRAALELEFYEPIGME